ncbi:hypothetical protein [Psychrobacter sp. LV10R520-6]|uniref:hypothetical protein n=1 Tax=Psychrobacter sp. LV10R520-6 TaxID=1415574 RepID=UPI0024CA834A|nr:hypothetical protein [Psychrobacter sp. LV10R520-6]SNT69619.1 hypothetical protein SAMN04488491_0714 [Psychrobacter sp. LV10R520-6]
MRINRQTIIKEIFANGFERDFFKFIDYIHENNTASEFPKRLYLAFYEKIVRVHKDNALKNIMSLDALVKSDVFVYDNKNSGMIGLSKAMYDFLVFLDISRSREFSSIEFANFRQNISATVKNIMANPSSSDDYKEAYTHFNKIINDILSEIKSNIEVLNIKVDEISDLYRQKEQGLCEISVIELYEKADKLYTRNIIPCLQFIDPAMRLQGGDTFIESLNNLQVFYEEKGLISDDIYIQYRKTAVTSYYKDLNRVTARLQHYLSSLAEDRKYFMVIERAFSDLVKSIEPLQHGRIQNKFLTADSKVLQHLNSLDGLFTFKQRYYKRLNRPLAQDDSMLAFKVWFEQIETRQIKPAPSKLKPLPMDMIIEHEKDNGIFDLMCEVNVPSRVDDIYLFVYETLFTALTDFSLIDVLYGIEYLLPLLDTNGLQQQNIRNKISDNKYFYEYIVLSYREEETI